MSGSKKVPARLHVLLAREAPVGLVIRRGPSKRVCTILWNRLDDTFTRGQWLKGRIYEHKCDLSPDGRHFLYFALDGKWKSERSGTWVAISRAPYLKAIGLWPIGDTWMGGGVFIDSSTYWLSGAERSALRNPTGLRRSADLPGDERFQRCALNVYYARLLLDGWNPTRVSRYRKLTIFDKAASPDWALRKVVDSWSCDDLNLLMHRRTLEAIEFPDWEWADIDRDRLVWTEHGKLFAGRVTPEGLSESTELYDFGSLVCEDVAAPY